MTHHSAAFIAAYRDLGRARETRDAHVQILKADNMIGSENDLERDETVIVIMEVADLVVFDYERIPSLRVIVVYVTVAV